MAYTSHKRPTHALVEYTVHRDRQSLAWTLVPRLVSLRLVGQFGCFMSQVIYLSLLEHLTILELDLNGHCTNGPSKRVAPNLKELRLHSLRCWRKWSNPPPIQSLHINVMTYESQLAWPRILCECRDTLQTLISLPLRNYSIHHMGLYTCPSLRNSSCS
ncbi:hypothetical protein PIIN_11817 [Serendipita indica DSM 11827]|uniref:Uncharacterized protein n=1 Tax=Serendipita indica (strain DSM 11827) TaxID=1109443 RepID=G4U0K3_SERID|nr:hypothetical protein PIIN_11817 [Serendipita indica DSM 11827]